MNHSPPLVFLLDVDNTLLDNDRLLAEFTVRLERDLGADGARHYWALSETVREELGYVDYLETLQRCRRAAGGDTANDSRRLETASFLLDYPFSERLYPRVFQLLAHLNRIGRTVIVSDGDAVLQPRKIRRSGLWAAVGGRVLIYVHKEQMIDAIRVRFPARHYVMIDDKPRILQAMKAIMQSQLTTVLPLQGHYALDAQVIAATRPADIRVARIGDLLDIQPHLLEGRTHVPD